MADKIYLQVDFKSANVYEYSKTIREGFDKHESTTGTVSYRRYMKKGVYGELMNASVRPSKFGTQLIITLKSDEGVYQNVQFSLEDQRGNLTDFSESITRVIGNMEKGKKYRIYPYCLTAEYQQESDQKAGNELRAKYYDSRGVSIKELDENGIATIKIDPVLSYSGSGDNVIPRVNWKEDKVAKKKKPSAADLEAKADFLKEKLMAVVEGPLAYTGPGAVPTQAKTVENAVTEVEEDDDDLPF